LFPLISYLTWKMTVSLVSCLGALSFKFFLFER
jgi:hypothetical protein